MWDRLVIAFEKHLRPGMDHHLSHSIRVFIRKKHECYKGVMGVVHGHVSQAFPSNYSSECDRQVPRPAEAG